jgi:hypothetical protein
MWDFPADEAERFIPVSLIWRSAPRHCHLRLARTQWRPGACLEGSLAAVLPWQAPADAGSAGLVVMAPPRGRGAIARFLSGLLRL